MRTKVTLAVFLATALTCTGLSSVVHASGETIIGMLTPFTGGESSTFIARPVGADIGAEITSISWHNNDGTTPLRELMVVGSTNGLPDLDNVLYSRVSVMGSSDATTQIVCESSGLCSETENFVVFELPPKMRLHRGVGGGPGVGVRAAEDSGHAPSLIGVIGTNGMEWVELPRGVEVAADVEMTGGGLGRSLGGSEPLADRSVVKYETGLQSVFPNPANPNVQVRFSMRDASRASIRVYNTRGQLVRTLLDRELPAGVHHVPWQGIDEDDRAVSSGVYFVQMRAGLVQHQQRVTLVR